MKYLISCKGMGLIPVWRPRLILKKKTLILILLFEGLNQFGRSIKDRYIYNEKNLNLYKGMGIIPYGMPRSFENQLINPKRFNQEFLKGEPKRNGFESDLF